MHTRRRSLALLAALGLASLSPALSAQAVPRALLVRGQQIPGAAPGRLAAFLDHVATNQVGGWAATVDSNGGPGGPQSYVWGNAADGPGTVLRAEGTVAGFVQTGFTPYFGLGDAGQIAYEADPESEPAVFLDDTPLALPGEASTIPGLYWCEGFSTGIAGDGTPHFQADLTPSTLGCFSTVRALMVGSPPAPLYMSGDLIPGVPEPVALIRGFDFSPNGGHHLVGVTPNVVRTLVLDGAALSIDGGLVRTGEPVPASAGGAPGDTWSSFLHLGVSNSGSYFVAGIARRADATFYSFLLVDGEIVLREGDVVDGLVLEDGLYQADVNDAGDVGVVWEVAGSAAEDQALIVNGRVLARAGDDVDLDGDGAPEADRPILAWSGAGRRLALGARRPDGSVPVLFTCEFADPTTLDDDVGLFRLESAPAECFLVLGEGTGGTSFETWFHDFAPQLDLVTRSWPVSLSDGPLFRLGPARAASAAPGSAGAGARLPLGAGVPLAALPRRFNAQVLMWNPWDFPARPEQWSNGLTVTVLPDGRWHAVPYGGTTGMQLWAEEVTNAAGERALRLPFSIPGF